jgi:hypothetical protein
VGESVAEGIAENNDDISDASQFWLGEASRRPVFVPGRGDGDGGVESDSSVEREVSDAVEIDDAMDDFDPDEFSGKLPIEASTLLELWARRAECGDFRLGERRG